MSFFSTFRIALFKGNPIVKYAAYAIGEIILVVIGILIAVAINNANEARKQDQLLTRYLQNYRNDLKVDSTVIANHLRLLDDKRKAFDLILSDTLTKAHLTEHKFGLGVIFNYNPFKLQTKGFNQLQSHVAENSSDADNLVATILANHTAFKALFELSIKRISDDIDDNLAYLKNNKSWLSDVMNANFTPEILDYFLSKDYKNRTALHKTYVYDNLYTFMQAYQSYMTEMNNELDERLKSYTQ